jgi:hypothetical protein
MFFRVEGRSAEKSGRDFGHLLFLSVGRAERTTRVNHFFLDIVFQ